MGCGIGRSVPGKRSVGQIFLPFRDRLQSLSYSKRQMNPQPPPSSLTAGTNQTSFGISTAPVNPGPLKILPVEAGVENGRVLQRVGIAGFVLTEINPLAVVTSSEIRNFKGIKNLASK